MKERPEFNPDNLDDDAMYTTAHVARLFGVTSETVRDWIQSNKLPGVRLPSGQWRVKRRDVIKFANHKFAATNHETDDGGAIVA